MKSSSQLFKKEIDNSFKDIKLNSSTMADAANFKNSFKESAKGKTKKITPKLLSVPKKENKEATSSSSSGAYSAPLFSGEEPDIKKVEATEATGSGSVGAYETPAAWAKSMGSKDWRGKSKTQIPGGSFVKVKDKCKKFPYCNQGDIKALDIYENDIVKEAIKNVSKKLRISETTIKAILQHEMEQQNTNKLDIYKEKRK